MSVYCGGKKSAMKGRDQENQEKLQRERMKKKRLHNRRHDWQKIGTKDSRYPRQHSKKRNTKNCQKLGGGEKKGGETEETIGRRVG